MVQSTNNKSPRLSTPLGEAVYPWLHGDGDKKFHDLGIYKADLRVPKKEAAPLQKKIAKLYEGHVGDKIPTENFLWTEEVDEAGDLTGNVIFKLRVKNVQLRDGNTWKRRPKLFDTSAPPKPIDVQPYGGTKMKVSFDVYAYNKPRKGLKLQPVAVQIIELIEGGNQETEDFGFEEMESGYKFDGTFEDDSNPFNETEDETENNNNKGDF